VVRSVANPAELLLLGGAPATRHLQPQRPVRPRPPLELLNQLGADGWELVGLQDYREGGDGCSCWEAVRLLTV
jgi:hypothetical protein